MKRKVIKQANQAYTITLPIEWVRKNKISKNSEVDIQIREKTLMVNTGESRGYIRLVQITGAEQEIRDQHYGIFNHKLAVELFTNDQCI